MKQVMSVMIKKCQTFLNLSNNSISVINKKRTNEKAKTINKINFLYIIIHQTVIFEPEISQRLAYNLSSYFGNCKVKVCFSFYKVKTEIIKNPRNKTKSLRYKLAPMEF